MKRLVGFPSNGQPAARRYFDRLPLPPRPPPALFAFVAFGDAEGGVAEIIDVISW